MVCRATAVARRSGATNCVSSEKDGPTHHTPKKLDTTHQSMALGTGTAPTCIRMSLGHSR
ncbi:hypothetical protein D3C81_2198600 [compost metagenome]